MILQLEMPFVDPAVRWVRVVRWCLAEGDAVTYGDDVCEVAVEEVERVNRVVHANRLSSVTARAGSGPLETHRVKGGLDYRVLVVASDVGWLRDVRVAPGTPVQTGEVLALLSTEAEEPLDDDGRSRPAFRVVADALEDEPEEA